MAYRIITCIRCKYYFGTDMETYQDLISKGYTIDQAFTLLGPQYRLPMALCCRRTISTHFSTVDDGIEYLNKQFEMKKHHLGLGPMPKWTGGMPQMANVFIDTELSNVETDFSELDALNLDVEEEMNHNSLNFNRQR
jgi:DNA-directed RNA polymerase subunit N (RpoN/RPB10)